jgi:hypothetical protein
MLRAAVPKLAGVWIIRLQCQLAKLLAAQVAERHMQRSIRTNPSVSEPAAWMYSMMDERAI